MKVDQPAVRGEESAACAQLSKSCSSPGGTGVQEEEEEEEGGKGLERGEEEEGGFARYCLGNLHDMFSSD